MTDVRGDIWTEREKAWLLENYPRLSGKMCAVSLSRSETAIRIQFCRIKHGRDSQVPRKKKLIPGNVSRGTG